MSPSPSQLDRGTHQLHLIGTASGHQKEDRHDVTDWIPLRVLVEQIGTVGKRRMTDVRPVAVAVGRTRPEHVSIPGVFPIRIEHLNLYRVGDLPGLVGASPRVNKNSFTGQSSGSVEHHFQRM